MAWIHDQQSAEYRKHRDELLEAELALKDQCEAVAEMRRRLPRGAKIERDYVFREGPADLTRNNESDFFDTRFTELFADGKNQLIVDHMMFAPESERGCPMCSMWADSYDSAHPHISDKVNFVLVARAPIAKLRDWGRQRGWRNIRLLSSHDNDFNPDMGVELAIDRQLPGNSVFVRDESGDIYHSLSTEGSLVERHHRMMDLFTPTWMMFDLLPTGREDWFPKHFYDK